MASAQRLLDQDVVSRPRALYSRRVALELLEAVRWSREHQARELIAWVAESNTAARTLYARVGFRPGGGRQPLPSNPAVDEVLLRLPLDSPTTREG
jgi:RimJ/RimL family protein N-acetyltransferase